MVVDDAIIKEHDLFIRSNGWLATHDIGVIPRYLDSTEFSSEDVLKVSDQLLDEIQSQEEAKFLTYHLVQPFDNISGDDFSLTFQLRNTYNEGPAVCQEIKIVILGSEGPLVIPFSIPGCVSNLNMMLNDVYMGGEKNDLSFLGADFKEWTDIALTVNDKEVSISINDSLRFKKAYQESIGKLVGLRYKFLGAGEVRNVEISNLTKESFYVYAKSD